MTSPHTARRTPATWRLILFAGPLALTLTILMLVAGRGYFEHGPGVPTAGRTEAWTLMWLGLALVLSGNATSTLGLATFALLRWRRREPLTVAAWWSTGYLLLVALPLFWLWFSS